MVTNTVVHGFIHGVVLATILLAGLVGTTGAALAAGDAGAVYTITNAISGNQVLIFKRAADGSLTSAGAVATGGNGNGPVIGLHSQGSVMLSQDNRWLFVVNAGSNSISSFSVSPSGLTLADTKPSGGSLPVSLAVHGNLLYVLDQGSDNILGFSVGVRGQLTSIPGSARALSHTGAAAAEIAFSPDGRTLVVTQKNTQTIDTFEISDDGAAGPAKAHPSNGAVPYGFAFDNLGRSYVTEAGPAAASSYAVGRDGSLTSISASVPTDGNAPLLDGRHRQRKLRLRHQRLQRHGLPVQHQPRRPHQPAGHDLGPWRWRDR